MSDAPTSVPDHKDPESAPASEDLSYPLESVGEQGGAGLGRVVRQLFLIGVPVLLAMAAFLYLSGKWGSEFRSKVTPGLTEEPSAPVAAAPVPALAPQELDELKERIVSTIRRDLTEKLQATEVLEVNIESLDTNADGSLDLGFMASYSKNDDSGKPLARSVESKLRLEKKGDDWHVTSISPQTSGLVIEDEELIQTAAKKEPKKTH